MPTCRAFPVASLIPNPPQPLTPSPEKMNRFPLWKYVLIGVTLVIAFLYTLPNFFGEVPAVQVSPIRSTEKVDAALLGRVESR